MIQSLVLILYWKHLQQWTHLYIPVSIVNKRNVNTDANYVCYWLCCVQNCEPFFLPYLHLDDLLFCRGICIQMIYCFALVWSNCECVSHPELRGDPVWLMECQNPRTKFFFSRILFSTAFWGMFCRGGSKWRCNFTHNCKQLVNRLKIPQGLSTLMFHQWSSLKGDNSVAKASFW